MKRKLEKGMDARYLTELEPALKKAYDTEKTNAILDSAWKRYEEICRENRNEPKKMWMHTRKRIYPAITAFDAMISCGISRMETEDILVNYYMDRSRPVGEKIKKLMKIPGLYKLVPKFFAKMTRSSFGDAAGFKRQFDIQSYKEFFAEAGYEDVAYEVVEGRMPCAIAVIEK